MSKILVISSYDLRRNSSSNIRILALIQSLFNNGFEIDLAYIQTSHEIDNSLDAIIANCCKNVYKLIANENNIENKNNRIIESSVKKKIKKNIINFYSKLFVYDIFQTQFKRINNKVIKSIKNEYDFIISSSEPRSSHKLARNLIKKCKITAKWIQYWGDPMTNDVASSKFFPFLEKKEEKKLLQEGDVILYTNPGCANYMKIKYPFAKDKINWIPTTDIKQDFLITSNSIEISYVGDYISRYRDVKPLYNACVTLGSSFVLAGNGDISLESTSKISVLGRVSREEANKIESESLILAVVDNNSPNNDICIQVPGKLYHFSLTNKYIIVITNSKDIINYYDKYKRFIFCNNDESSIIDTINKIKLGKYDSSYHSSLDAFSQKEVYKLFINIIEKTD